MTAHPGFHSFSVSVEHMNKWNLSAKVYNFFEIIHVLEGKGERYFNKIKLPYEPGQLLIYTPQDCRSFTIEEPSRFLFIRFSDVLFSTCETKAQHRYLSEWMKSLEYLFFNHNHATDKLVKNDRDCAMVKSILATVLTESETPQLHYRDNIQHLLQVLLNIFARNIQQDTRSLTLPTHPEPVINVLTGYIRKNIYEPEKLQLNALSEIGGLGKNYIGEYFKKHAGTSIRQYILEYRLNLVKVRLQYSDLTISEIAHELNFSDESHLSNLFKKYFSQSPSSFRKTHREL